jgi:hypothetical protein
MNILITEEHQKILLNESLMDDLNKVISELSLIGKKSFIETKKIFKFDIKFLLTWSSSIAGFIGPLNDFISGNYPNLNDENIFMISLGVSSILFYNNLEEINKIFEKINENGLTNEFNTALKKGSELKESLIKFLYSIGISVSNLTNIISFTFLIPILGIVYSMVQTSSFSSEQIFEIGERIAAAGITSFSSSIISNIIKKSFNK